MINNDSLFSICFKLLWSWNCVYVGNVVESNQANDNPNPVQRKRKKIRKVKVVRGHSHPQGINLSEIRYGLM